MRNFIVEIPVPRSRTLSFPVIAVLCSHRQMPLFFCAVGYRLVPVKRQHVLIQQQLNLAHCVVDKGRCQLALPYHDHLPPVPLQQAIVLLIPSAVTVDFGLPEADVALRDTGFPAILVTVPEAPVDEYRCPVGAHHDIRLPWDALYVETVAVPVAPQPFPHLQLGFRVPAVNMRHTDVPLVGRKHISHSSTYVLFAAIGMILALTLGRI